MNKQQLIQQIKSEVAEALKDYDRLETPQAQKRVLIQAINAIDYIVKRESVADTNKAADDPPCLTEPAWRLLSFIAQFESGCSYPFLSVGLPWSIDDPIDELLQAGLIEKMGEMKWYRVVQREV